MTKNSLSPIARNLSISAALILLSGSLMACSTTQNEPKSVASGAACTDLGAAEDVVANFYAPGSVYDARPIRETVFKARAIQPVETMGASLYVKAEPGMNSPYLQRVLSCHAASGAEAHPNDPLHPSQGAVTQLAVREAKHGFAVEVRSDDPAVGREIWKRAESLSQGQGSVAVEQVAAGPHTSLGM